MQLNPLIKIDNLAESKCHVKLLIEQKTYQVDKRVLLTLIDLIGHYPKRDDLQREMACSLSASEEVVNSFLDNLQAYKIVVDDTHSYPLEQINYWQEHKWLNALIYHLESQNRICFDDGTIKGEDQKNYDIDMTSSNFIWKKYSGEMTIIKLPNTDLASFNDIVFEEVLMRRNSFSPFHHFTISSSINSNQ
jgi:hypothetical protein